MFRLPLVLLFSSLLMPVFSASADDWPQWLGVHRDSVWNEDGIIQSFPEGGPKILWRVPVEGGYAGPAVADGRVFLTDYQLREGDATPSPNGRSALRGKERVHCYDAQSGQLIWSHEYECPYNISYACGPRATPTVDGDRVYTLGAEGNLFCFNVADGEVIWSRELKRDYGMKEATIWGFAGHPLVHGDKLICLVGGEGSVAVAFDKQTGQQLWKALSSEDPGYCPPTMIHAGGTDQLIIWHSESINGLNPETGSVYWSVPLKPDYGMSIVAPIQHGDYLFAAGVGNRSVVLQLDRLQPKVTEVWRDKGAGPVHSPVIIDDGYIYVVDRPGQLRCVELKTGERIWESTAPTTNDRPQGSATAFMVKNRDRYFIASETGDLILARMSPHGYEEIDRYHMLEPTGDAFNRKVVWSHPAFANRCVYARNDKELICVSLADE